MQSARTRFISLLILTHFEYEEQGIIAELAGEYLRWIDSLPVVGESS